MVTEVSGDGKKQVDEIVRVAMLSGLEPAEKAIPIDVLRALCRDISI